jgi:hypothetical protein
VRERYRLKCSRYGVGFLLILFSQVTPNTSVSGILEKVPRFFFVYIRESLILRMQYKWSPETISKTEQNNKKSKT